MTSHRLYAVSLLACLLYGCGGPTTPAAQRAQRASMATGDILVGAAWPWEARKSLLYSQGMEMALDEVNGGVGVGGRHIKLVKEDDHETVDKGRAVAQKLSGNPDIVAVIGHLESYITVPAAAIYDTAGILLVAPTSTDPALTEQGYKLVVRTTFNDKQVGANMATVAGARGYHHLAIYYMGDRYGISQANAFEETFSRNGGVVVDRRSYDAGETTNARPLGDLLDDWKSRGLDAVFIAGEAAQAALLMAEARRKGLHLPLLGGDAVGTPDLFGVDDKAVEGATVASAFHPDDRRPEVQRFRKAFEARYHRVPDTAAALAYDSVQVLTEGMRKANSSVPGRVRDALRAMPPWPGVTGSFSFADTGDLVARPLTIVVAHGGRFVFSANGTTSRTD